MLELERIYSADELQEITGIKSYKFRYAAQSEKRLRNCVGPERFRWYFKGKDVIRWMQTTRKGKQLLKQWGTEYLPEEFFKDDDIAELKELLKHLEEIKIQRERALQITVEKIDETKAKILELSCK